MSRYCWGRSTIVVFFVIIAASAGTARSAVRVRIRPGFSDYDPYGLQYHYKPWGASGPEFTAPNIPRILDVLDGRAPLNPRVARRMVSSSTVQFRDVNLSITKPDGSWVRLDPKKTGSHACFLARRNDPTVYISLAAERVGEEAGETNHSLLAASQAKMKSLPGATVTPGERELSAGGIEGIAYGATVTVDGRATHYAMWVAAHHGYVYKLAIYGDQNDEAEIDATLLNLVRGMKQIAPTRVAHSGAKGNFSR
ncbi:MAG TPA: hypothetical protein VFW73_12435 [Lacipirellulaceae bacterium]|nr:hypothetical protein [Lacipirellulaceae bacterium]